MAKKPVKLRCARTVCRKLFAPKNRVQRYCSAACKNRENQDRIRARARTITELNRADAESAVL